MYGLPPEIDLEFLKGKEICQIAIGPNDVQFNYGDGGISVWAKFTYKPADSEAIVWNGNDPRLATATVRLLLATIITVSWNVGGTLNLKFSNGDELEIYDPEPGSEAYS